MAPSFTRSEKRTVTAYLYSRAACGSMRGDAVHFASFAFGESPHSTVQFSSGEAICNNTSGIETMEREEIPAVVSSEKKKRKSAEIRADWLGCGGHSPPPVYLNWAAGVTRSPRMQCGDNETSIKGHNSHKHPCDRYCGQTFPL